jgi:hypothetical protein
MKRKHTKTLDLIFKRPVSANVKFDAAMALLVEIGAEIDESREGSRVAVILSDDVKVMHKPHPDPNMDKGAVVDLRDWLKHHGVTP